VLDAQSNLSENIHWFFNLFFVIVVNTTARRRALRLKSTDAEQHLWRRLRNRQLDGLKFRRQETVGPFITDFLCYEARLVVELDGGHHANDSQQTADSARTRFLEQQGYRVLRFWNWPAPIEWSTV